MKTKVVKFFKLFLSLFPTRLPVGMNEFYLWADSILELADVPNNDSTVFSLATMILHLAPTMNYKPKYYFIKALNKAASNEIAAGVMRELKDKQQKRAAEEAAKTFAAEPAKPAQ